SFFVQAEDGIRDFHMTGVQTCALPISYRPHLPEGVVLCNARGVHDAGPAEWAAGALIAVVREFPEFADAQRRGAWTYRHTPALSSEERRVGGECRARGVHLQLDRRVGQ